MMRTQSCSIERGVNYLSKSVGSVFEPLPWSLSRKPNCRDGAKSIIHLIFFPRLANCSQPSLQYLPTHNGTLCRCWKNSMAKSPTINTTAPWMGFSSSRDDLVPRTRRNVIKSTGTGKDRAIISDFVPLFISNFRQNVGGRSWVTGVEFSIDVRRELWDLHLTIPIFAGPKSGDLIISPTQKHNLD